MEFKLSVSNVCRVQSLRRILGLGALIVQLNVACVAAEKSIEFNRDIRPILSDKCFACHGPDAKHRQAELRLDVASSALKQAIVPGKPHDSKLIARITSDDADERMPPADSGKSLSPDEVKLLREWIAQGAQYQEYWAYVAPVRRATPAVQATDWPLNWIDHFVLSRLEQEGIKPSPDADQVTLVRRLYFDLIGLPPTPDEIDEYLQSARSDPQSAFESLVDRLLGSERFGERLAMYWLDLVRYADTVGYHGDQEHNISPYRDWVIDALNTNMPFDQFTRDQLAGDLLPNSNVDQKIATGYNRLLQTSHEGGVQAKEYLAIYAADRIRNLSGVWLGATMGCAQCHDHKFDPFTAHDFYSMVAVFADIDEAQHLKKGSDTNPTIRQPELQVLTRRERELLAECDARLDRLRKETSAAGESANRAEQLEAIQKLEQQCEQLRKNARQTMITVAIEPRTIRLLPRGNWLDDSGPIVQPAVPAFLANLDVGDRRATRLDLANWLADPDKGVGGLTARVFANRFWYLLFGSGIARVLDDFGGQGEPPSHPELLDALAVEFYESDWNVKHLLKLIVMSRAYRQSSLASPQLQQRDPLNRLFARQSRYQLPAETIRDNALAVSGLLLNGYVGPSVRPYQPAGYFKHLNFPPRTYQHDVDSRQWRRGVYVHWQRQYLHPTLKALDAPSREECTAQRPQSNTPLASLALLNDPTFVEAARVFAQRIMVEGGDSADSRMNFAFRHAVSRQPDATERQLLEKLRQTDFERYSKDIDAAKKLIAVGQSLVAKDIDAAELAAWTSVARAIFNLHETMARN